MISRALVEADLTADVEDTEVAEAEVVIAEVMNSH